MTNTISFLSILIIFMRLYSIFGINFLTDSKAKIAERITVFLLIFEIFIIFLYSIFDFFRFLLPPVFIFLKTVNYEIFIFRNISAEGFFYTVVISVLLLTFNMNSDNIKNFNRILLTYIFLINAILGIMTIF